MTDHPQIQHFVTAARRYRAGEIDIESLQGSLSTAMSTLEGDVPKEIHIALRKAEAWVDSIRFTVSKAEQAARVEPVLAELEGLVHQFLHNETAT